MTLVCSHQVSLSSFTFTATEDWGEKEIFCNKKASVGEKEGEGRGSGNRNYLLFPVHSPPTVHFNSESDIGGRIYDRELVALTHPRRL